MFDDDLASHCLTQMDIVQEKYNKMIDAERKYIKSCTAENREGNQYLKDNSDKLRKEFYNRFKILTDNMINCYKSNSVYIEMPEQ